MSWDSGCDALTECLPSIVEAFSSIFSIPKKKKKFKHFKSEKDRSDIFELTMTIVFGNQLKTYET